MKPSDRPTEWTGALGSLVTVLAVQAGASDQLITALATCTGAFTVLATAIVANGGLQGLYVRLRYGRRNDA